LDGKIGPSKRLGSINDQLRNGVPFLIEPEAIALIEDLR
jgi:hypothetical protein